MVLLMRAWYAALSLSVMLILSAIVGLSPAVGVETAAIEHVHIDDFEYMPDELIVRPGDTVEWDNHDTVPHDATADNDDWFTAVLSTGESDSLIFNESGTWGYHCSIHPEIEGTLHVNVLPAAVITSPADGSTVSGLVTLGGTASDVDGTVEEVEVRIDAGDWQSATGTTSWSYDWDTQQSLNGPRLVEARSYDGLEYSEPDAITLNVDNPLFVDLEITEDDIQVSPAGPEDLVAPKTIEVTVHNNGNAMSAEFLVQVEYEHEGETHLLAESTLVVGPFDTNTVTVFWDATGMIGDFDVTAAADRAGETGDVDPDNNESTATGSVVVAGVPGIDLSDPLP